MTLDDVPAHGTVVCTVTLADGKRVTVGHFGIRSGYGAWAVWLRDLRRRTCGASPCSISQVSRSLRRPSRP